MTGAAVSSISLMCGLYHRELSIIAPVLMQCFGNVLLSLGFIILGVFVVIFLFLVQVIMLLTIAISILGLPAVIIGLIITAGRTP